jgi:hypothetical protein
MPSGAIVWGFGAMARWPYAIGGSNDNRDRAATRCLVAECTMPQIRPKRKPVTVALAASPRFRMESIENGESLPIEKRRGLKADSIG